MKKSILFLVANLMVFSGLFSQTEVSGGIYSSTTWSQTNSPYIVVGDIVIFEGCNLNIEPGVIVKVDNNNEIEVRGSLQAIGSISDSIIFIASFRSSSDTIWKGFTVLNNASLSYSYCRIEDADKAIYFKNGHYGVYQINNTYFGNNNYGYYGDPFASLTTSNCTFQYNGTAVYSTDDKVFTDCSFVSNEYGVYKADGCSFYNCNFISNSEIGIHGWRYIIDNCTFDSNNLGLRFCFQDNPTLSNNLFTNNTIGLNIVGVYDDATVINNTFCGDNLYSIQNTVAYNFDFANSCWCVGDSSLISEKIYDGYDDISVGLINFTPFYTDCGSSNPELIGESNPILIYPNPTKGKLSIDIPDRLNKEIIVEVFNMQGKLIINNHLKPNASNSIDLSEEPKGVYLIKANVDDNPIIMKIILI